MSQVRLQNLENKVNYVNKQAVKLLVSRLRAEWVIYGILAKMLPEAPGLERLRYYRDTPATDSRLPSAELPGLSFLLHGKRVWDGKQTREWLLDANG